jgi:hypothetical protein
LKILKNQVSDYTPGNAVIVDGHYALLTCPEYEYIDKKTALSVDL